MTESIVCRTGRANPAQFITLNSIRFDKFCAQKYNVMVYKEMLSIDKVEILAGRFSLVSRRDYVSQILEKISKNILLLGQLSD